MALAGGASGVLGAFLAGGASGGVIGDAAVAGVGDLAAASAAATGWVAAMVLAPHAPRATSKSVGVGDSS